MSTGAYSYSPFSEPSLLRQVTDQSKLLDTVGRIVRDTVPIYDGTFDDTPSCVALCS